MPRFAANLSTLFNEVPFADRFAAAAKAGFKGVELLFPYAYSAGELADALKANNLTQVLFNLPPGDWDAGERGLAALPGREADFAATIQTSLEYAAALGCRQVHALAGIPQQGTPLPMARQVYVQNIRRAARAAAPVDVTILLEPINTADMPGYFLNTTEQAREVIDEVGEANVRLQLDLYHRQNHARQLGRRHPRVRRHCVAHPNRRRSRAPRAQYRGDRLPVPFRSSR